jgi:hypothetical protein
MGFHMLQSRLNNLEERHERTGRQHPADNPDQKSEPILPGIFPNAPVGFPPRIFAIEKLFSVLYLSHAFYG